MVPYSMLMLTYEKDVGELQIRRRKDITLMKEVEEMFLPQDASGE